MAQLGHTLTSASQLGNASVLLVGHDYPDGLSSLFSFEWVQATFDAPSENSPAAKMQDKGLKSRLGVQHTASQGKHEWVMFMDADDFISRKLFNLADFDRHDAIYVSNGYRYKPGSQYCQLLSQFHLVCGTSWIMRLSKTNFPMWLGQATTGRVCDQPHNKRLNALLSCGARVQRIDHPAAIYLCHGANSYYGSGVSPKSLASYCRTVIANVKAVIKARRVTRELREEFGLPERAGNKATED